ncbi:MAG: HAD family hydrolase, partial [Pseudomonadota bacterium]|nr:HAD family hydrolase [Pseudomonadota bacterium]
WHNESVFHLTQRRYCELLGPYAEPGDLMARLLSVEQRNLRLYGYGIKGFTLSMIETALQVTDERAPPSLIATILEFGRAMLEHPIEPLPKVSETLQVLAGTHRLVLITKGDLLDQEQKLARSRLGEHFSAVEIVSEKSAAAYRTIFLRHGASAGSAAMAGNSLRSDVIPAIEAGYFGVHIPYALLWHHEHAEPPAGSPLYARLESFDELPRWLANASPTGATVSPSTISIGT